MRFYRPQSFFALLLTGFIFVALPLFTALFSTVQVLDGVVRQSTLAVYNSVDRTGSVRHITELLQDQERKARLYSVLGESMQLDGVNKVHENIETAFAHLLSSTSDAPMLSTLLQELKAQENLIVAGLNSLSGGPEQRKLVMDKILDRYKQVDVMVRELASTSNTIMSYEVGQLRAKVNQGKETLAWQTSGLIGFSVLFLVVFVILISKPIRQIDHGIENLGNGDFETPIQVSGPSDLEALGERLDWLRRRLAELDREKVKMIAHISHELKTPLSSIKEGAGLLRDELVGPMNPSQKDVVSILDKNSDKLQRLIEDILNFNMSQARKVPVAMQEVSLDNIVNSVISDHNNTMLARRIAVDVHLDKITMKGDGAQLKTVFDNLLANAVKFTPDDGVIQLSLKKENNEAIFLVEDSGVGIDKEDRSRIFSPFFQGKEAKRAVVKGSGLGLAIAKEYVQNHGGEIRLLSSKSGARFSVILPMEV